MTVSNVEKIEFLKESISTNMKLQNVYYNITTNVVKTW